MLARKGYPSGLAFQVVREALLAEGELEADDLRRAAVNVAASCGVRCVAVEFRPTVVR